eukprot:1811680-Pyramimonas_sp.AAC.1
MFLTPPGAESGLASRSGPAAGRPKPATRTRFRTPPFLPQPLVRPAQSGQYSSPLLPWFL